MIYGAAWNNQPFEIFSTRLEGLESRSLGASPANILGIASNGQMASHLPRARVLGRLENRRTPALDHARPTRLRRRAVRQYCDDAGRENLGLSLSPNGNDFISCGRSEVNFFSQPELLIPTAAKSPALLDIPARAGIIEQFANIPCRENNDTMRPRVCRALAALALSVGASSAFGAEGPPERNRPSSRGRIYGVRRGVLGWKDPPAM